MSKFDIKQSINGDRVIGFTNTAGLKTNGWLDSSKVATYLRDNSDSEDYHTKHLGMIDLFETTHNTSLPFMKDLFANSAVLEVEEGQTITYDLSVNREEMNCYTTGDTSGLNQYPGKGETYFEIILNTEFAPGDVLAYDMQYGAQLVISSEHSVKNEGENFRHMAQLASTNGASWFPVDKLKAGIEYFKVSNALAEFDTTFSGVNMNTNPMGTMRLEFTPSSPRGVETFITERAYNAHSNQLKKTAEGMKDSIMKNLDAYGADKSVFFMGKGSVSNFDQGSMKVGSTLEYLMLLELAQMECHQLMFAKGFQIQSANGVRRMNEGAWHQMRRGKLIKFSKPGGITINHLREAAQYVHRDKNTPINQRVTKFKAGHFAHLNVMEIFREEAISQLNNLPAGMLGTDAQIDPVFSGSTDSLTMKMVGITGVTIPGIGQVEVEHDPSLDYQPHADRFSAGTYGNGYAHTSHSLVIWDATDSDYSNVSQRVSGASLVEGGASRTNVYYVKPTGNHVQYGFEQGRMANGSEVHEVQSSMKYMAKNCWAKSQSDALVLDTTRYVTIELDRNDLA